MVFVFSELQLPFCVWISCLQILFLPFGQIGPYLYSDSNISDLYDDDHDDNDDNDDNDDDYVDGVENFDDIHGAADNDDDE